MSQSHLALLVIDLDRLTVGPVRAACGSVSCVAYRDPALRELTKVILVKDFIDETQILQGTEYTVVVYNYTATFLASVLESIKSVIDHIREVAHFRSIKSENAAFFM